MVLCAVVSGASFQNRNFNLDLDKYTQAIVARPFMDYPQHCRDNARPAKSSNFPGRVAAQPQRPATGGERRDYRALEICELEAQANSLRPDSPKRAAIKERLRRDYQHALVERIL
jgi:hypothetical protein